jgi:hypothetical protein
VNGLSLSDDELMTELSRLAIQFDTVPADVVSKARASYSAGSAWDVALAKLVYDSTTDQNDARALVRAGPGARDLTFESPELTIEVEIAPSLSSREGHFQILGQLVPAGAASIEVRRPDGSHIVSADELGRFAVEDTTPGPISLRCTPAGTASTDTEWILI